MYRRDGEHPRLFRGNPKPHMGLHSWHNMNQSSAKVFRQYSLLGRDFEAVRQHQQRRKRIALHYYAYDSAYVDQYEYDTTVVHIYVEFSQNETYQQRLAWERFTLFGSSTFYTTQQNDCCTYCRMTFNELIESLTIPLLMFNQPDERLHQPIAVGVHRTDCTFNEPIDLQQQKQRLWYIYMFWFIKHPYTFAHT